MLRDLVCAVDVGTASVRAGLFDRTGRMRGRAENRIELVWDQPDRAEYSSEHIWDVICLTIRELLAASGNPPERIASLGFDATCSLVLRSARGDPVSVSATGDDRLDTIAWLDHRALEEADACTATGHPILQYLGGSMSPEMQIPKLMWLKRHCPAEWGRAAHFFDLADYLTWKATGTVNRSVATLATKWGYLPRQGGWQTDFLDKVNLLDLPESDGMSASPLPLGEDIGTLSANAAEALGLDTGCVVSTGLVDAYAGALGVIGGLAGGAVENQFALITGTSGCIMTMADAPLPIPSIWGPFHSAAPGNYWISEGGQSASGAVLDYVVDLFTDTTSDTEGLHDRIAARIIELRAAGSLDDDLFVLPDFHGNRSPHGDARARGAISGLTLDRSFDGMCRVYWRAAVSIALSVRQVLELLKTHGRSCETLHIAGGQARNSLLVELYADSTGVTIAESESPDPVLLGTAMVAATSAGWHRDLLASCRTMRQPHRRHRPNATKRAGFDRDYAVFLKMQEHRREIEELSRQHGG